MSDGAGLTARKIEQTLRDAGISKSLARAIIAGGFKAAMRDDADATKAEPLVQTLKAATDRLKGLTQDDRLRY